jgi:hypothetical protein
MSYRTPEIEELEEERDLLMGWTRPLPYEPTSLEDARNYVDWLKDMSGNDSLNNF